MTRSIASTLALTGESSLSRRIGSMGLGSLAGSFAVDRRFQRHVAILAFALINPMAFAVAVAVMFPGWLLPVITGNGVYLIAWIAIPFFAGLCLCGYQIARIESTLDRFRYDDGDLPSSLACHADSYRSLDTEKNRMGMSTIRLILASRIVLVRHPANSLVLLGLIGTVIGFIIAFFGVDPDQGSSIDAIGPMVGTLISGMSLALNTSSVGAVLNLWLMAGYRLAEARAAWLLTVIAQRGQRHGQP